MRLLLDTLTVASPGGIQHRIEIARALDSSCPSDWDVLMVQPREAWGVPSTEKLRIETLDRPRSWFGYWRWINRGLPDKARECGADVIYSQSGIVSSGMCRVAGVVDTINNMLPFATDQIREFYATSRHRIRLPLLRRAYVSGSRRADAVVVPSRFGLEQVSARAGDLSHKAFVALNAVPDYVRHDPAVPPPHPHSGAPFLFYLSVMSAYKNHLTLIEAYRRAAGNGHLLPDMFFAGPPEERDYVDRLQAAIRTASLEKRVTYLGKIPREDIPGWLHHATINVFPSLCETSSFVQTEILGMHGVMACSNVAPMPEVAGGAAELFDPRDPDSIAEVLVRLCRDLPRREELRRLAAMRAAALSPAACGAVLWQAVLHAATAFEARRARS